MRQSSITVGEIVDHGTPSTEPPTRRRGRSGRLSTTQLIELHDLLRTSPETHGYEGDQWTYKAITQLIDQNFGVSFNQTHIRKVLDQVNRAVFSVVPNPVYSDERSMLYRGDAVEVLQRFPSESIDCIVTSPPYYGQRDYGVEGQLGLEEHPQNYIDRLIAVFEEAKRVLKPTGSLWVNLGDTYWSGKGQSHGTDRKQKNRRFLRPQDKTGPRPLCTPKQLLLIPHRFAIAMQDHGWVVRNDNVWYKLNPTPDPVKDRCASAHEYMFHFVKQRKYYFDHAAVAVPSQGQDTTKAPPSVWPFHSAPTFKKHIAVFPTELVRIPILATLPKDGVFLDPFCGSATALSFALAQGGAKKVIGIDISLDALMEAKGFLTQSISSPSSSPSS